jgi:hypothetical protein
MEDEGFFTGSGAPKDTSNNTRRCRGRHWKQSRIHKKEDAGGGESHYQLLLLQAGLGLRKIYSEIR